MESYLLYVVSRIWNPSVVIINPWSIWAKENIKYLFMYGHLCMCKLLGIIMEF